MRTLIACIILTLLLVIASPAQTNETVLYSFGTNGGTTDGSEPNGTLLFDGVGDLYGTTFGGGTTRSALCQNGCGTVFELTPSENGWKETVLHSFADGTDGLYPLSGLVLDEQGNLYGTTQGSGQCQVPDCGTVFELSPQTDGSWVETILYAFTGSPDGAFPIGPVLFDGSGNLYGTTYGGGADGYGTVFELSPPSAPNSTWTEKVLYSFCQLGGGECSDGGNPYSGVIFDKSGNLYGTTSGGGVQGEWGLVYELTPQSNGAWTESVLYKFPGEGVGGIPKGNVSFDEQGRLYGTIEFGGMKSPHCLENPIPPYVKACGGGFRLTPKGSGRWSGQLGFFDGKNGGNPLAGLTIDGSAVYGSTYAGGDNNVGVVFLFARNRLSVLHTFCSQFNCTDGEHPIGNVTFNAGQVYGATQFGGTYNQGVIFTLSQ